MATGTPDAIPETATLGHWTLLIFGVVRGLTGIALATGGAWLAAIGGSWYYLLAGIGLVVSGIQLARTRWSGLSGSQPRRRLLRGAFQGDARTRRARCRSKSMRLKER